MTVARALFAAILVAGIGSSANARVPRDVPPNWAADAVWYQIFPERFRNGDPRNDPAPKDLKGSWPQDPIGAWSVHPWTSDWYRLPLRSKASAMRRMPRT